MNLNQISVVIPAKNEEENLALLISRIHNALLSANILYEIIVIDDRSTDATIEKVKVLKQEYPIRLFVKQGASGKAQCLLEGFKYARFGLICMIDGDLQYPPESIPKMLEKIKLGDDIVVGDRKEFNASLRRKIISRIFKSFFGKFLHGFEVDIQSGLKLFKKEIVERLALNPSPWTFDLEFLSKARNAGYKISGLPIAFQKRFAGK